MDVEVTLGETYRDGPSGFTGEAIARAVYKYEVPAASDSRWIAEARLQAAVPPGSTGFGSS
jgi:hypothetical protein